MPLDQLPTPTHPETKAGDDAGAPTLHAVFRCEDGDYRGARCELPTGEVIEVRHRRTPLFAICRELDALGYGDCRIEISTPVGTPSMRAVVRVAAGLTIKERDRGGLRLERFQKFPGPLTDGREAPRGTQTPANKKTRVSESTEREKAA